MRITRDLLGLGAVYFSLACAHAQTIRTDFSCAPPAPHNPLASAICHNAEAAAAEFQFSRVYYALRNQVGKGGYQKLKSEVLQDDRTLNEQCNIPEPGESDRPLTDEQVSCYVKNQSELTARYSSRLSQAGLEETSRSVEQHVAAQERLISLGYLEGVAKADGIYGDSTRSAIIRWQGDRNLSDRDGFISDYSLSLLMAAPEAQTDALAQKMHDLAQSQDAPHPNEPASDIQPNSSNTPHISADDDHSTGTFVIITVLIFVSGVYALVRLGRRRHYEDISDKVKNEIESQKRNLQITRSQKLTKDMYGTIVTQAWEKEILYFMRTRVEPIISAGQLGLRQQNLLRREALTMIEALSSHPLPVSVPTPAFVSSPAVFDPRMDPFHYEQYCALLLQTAGWDAYATQKSGDQGADVIATKHGVKIVIQCKLYTNTVGNDSVQQVYTAQRFQGAQGAIVVTNSAFTQSAKQAASSTGVILAHHAQLVDVAEGLLASREN